jgi:hypothetical protein
VAALVVVVVVAHGSQEPVDGTITDPSAVVDPFLDRFAEMDPTRMRETPFSSLAWEKLVYERSTGDPASHVLPGSNVKLQVVKLTRSVPKNRVRTCAATPPWTLCPES